MTDQEIKKLVKRYQAGDKQAQQILLGELWSWIYFFPQSVFDKDPEECSDYIEDIISRFSDILDSFQDRNNRFSTWFYRVLYNSCLNSINRKRSEPQVVSLDTVDNIKAVFNEEQNGNVPDLFSSLSVQEQLVLRMRYPEFLREEDLDLIAYSYQKKWIECARFFRKAQQRCMEERCQNRITEDAIQTTLFAKQRVQYCLRMQLSYSISSYSDLKMRYARLDKRRSRLLKAQKERLATFSYRELAEFLSIPLGSVATLVYRAKKKIAKRFSKKEDDRYNVG